MAPLDRHHIEQCRNGDDLVRLVRYLDLPEHQALERREGRHYVDPLLGTPLLVGAAQRLVIDRDGLGRRAGYRRDPRHEAALERCGIEHREDIAEVIVRWRA